jgi:hypothetical protein
VPAQFHRDTSKRWPVGASKIRAHKEKDKLVDVPRKKEVPSLSSMYRLIELGARNFFPETIPFHHFRFLHNRSKTVDFVEIVDRIKI